jgi:hypothetical protein
MPLNNLVRVGFVLLWMAQQWRLNWKKRRLGCLLMSATKVHKLMRKTRRNKGRNAEFYVIELTRAADQPTKFHTREELTADQREHFRSLLYDDFPE